MPTFSLAFDFVLLAQDDLCHFGDQPMDKAFHESDELRLQCCGYQYLWNAYLKSSMCVPEEVYQLLHYLHPVSPGLI